LNRQQIKATEKSEKCLKYQRGTLLKIQLSCPHLIIPPLPKQTISFPHSFRFSVSTMDLSLAASPSSFDLLLLNSHKFSLFQFNPDFSLKSKKPPTKSLFWRQNRPFRVRALNDDGFVLEDVPHLTDFLPHLPVINHSVFPSLKLPFLFSILGFFFFFCSRIQILYITAMPTRLSST